jgi:hypothetical protein
MERLAEDVTAQTLLPAVAAESANCVYGLGERLSTIDLESQRAGAKINATMTTVVQHSKIHLRRRLGLVESGQLTRCTEGSKEIRDIWFV